MSRFKKHINNETQFYFSSPTWEPKGVIYSVVDGKVVIEHDNIESLKKHKLVIANLSYNAWDINVQTMVYNLLDEHGVNFMQLVGDPRWHQQKPRMYFYPYHLYEGPDELIWPEYDPDSFEKKYLVSCLNGVPRPHRVHNYMLLRKKSYYDQCLVNFHSFVASGGGDTRGDDELVPTDIWKEWSEIRDTLPIFKPRVWLDVNHPAYTDSYINLVTETTVINQIYITEKTWKPIACGQLFLLIGNPNSIEHLQDMGVDTFDDIIDHKYYDRELDFKTRLARVHEVLDDLVKQDLPKIYQQTRDRRLKNHQNYFSCAFDNQNWHNQVVNIIEANK